MQHIVLKLLYELVLEQPVERFDYKEAGPQLLLQAFLQKIINDGGRVEQKNGIGRMRTDLLVIWPYPDGVQEDCIGVKDTA